MAVTAKHKSPLEDFSYLFLSSEKERQNKSQFQVIQGMEDTEKFLDFYGLSSNPFGDSLNTQFFLKTKQHDAVYQKLKLTIEQNISLGLLTGKSGTGKTLITQLLLNTLDPKKYQTVVVLVSPGMTKTALLHQILMELGLSEKIEHMKQVSDLIKLLQSEVLELHTHGKRLVIMIDEAHFLESSSLHILRTISNLETPEAKLVTCLLFAEDFFMRRLSHESYDSIRSRMYVKEHLEPLSLYDMKKYIQFRISAAGGKSVPFKEETYEPIHTATSGIPREINNLCFNALIQAFTAHEKVITNQILLSIL